MFTLVVRQIFLAGVPLKRITSCASFSLVQKYLISIARERCRLMVLLEIPTAVALSQWTGVLDCGWPRSSSVSRKIIPSWQFKNNAPNSASAAEATTNDGAQRVKRSIQAYGFSVDW
jgi:hypothetical protein